MRFEHRPFKPAWWLPGPHLQTIGARFLRRNGDVPFVRERIELPDGDFIDLDYPFSRPDDAAGPLVLLLHGLEGSARSKYALETYRALHSHGVPAVGFNFRSCSGELNRLARSYHSGDTGDLGFVVEWLRARFPKRTMGAVGFSLGGNVLLKYLGESGAAAAEHLVAAAAISVPYDLGAGADHLTRPGGWIYTNFLLRKLRRKIGAKRSALPPVADPRRALRARSFRAFDDAATAPIHGFADAEDYYSRSSSCGFIDAIRIPTLLIHSQDDPFLPVHAIPVAAANDNDHVTPLFTPAGGHVGFVSGSLTRPLFWAEREVARFLAERLEVGHAPATSNS